MAAHALVQTPAAHPGASGVRPTEPLMSPEDAELSAVRPYRRYRRTNPKTIGALLGMTVLGSGTIYGAATNIETRKEMSEMLGDHMHSGHPEVREMEFKLREVEMMMKEVKTGLDRMTRRADLTLLMVVYNQEVTAYLLNGKQGEIPRMPSKISDLQFELSR